MYYLLCTYWIAKKSINEYVSQRLDFISFEKEFIHNFDGLRRTEMYVVLLDFYFFFPVFLYIMHLI